jgi:Asp-tRNA(Asn)/Glu-tRNA(Gln) amidotransferase A subunit family amidase
MSEAIAYAGIRELGARYRRRELSPVEVTRALLARIEKLDPTLHAFVTVTADRALADARAAEEAGPRRRPAAARHPGRAQGHLSHARHPDDRWLGAPRRLGPR